VNRSQVQSSMRGRNAIRLVWRGLQDCQFLLFHLENSFGGANPWRIRSMKSWSVSATPKGHTWAGSKDNACLNWQGLAHNWDRHWYSAPYLVQCRRPRGWEFTALARTVMASCWPRVRDALAAGATATNMAVGCAAGKMEGVSGICGPESSTGNSEHEVRNLVRVKRGCGRRFNLEDAPAPSDAWMAPSRLMCERSPARDWLPLLDHVSGQYSRNIPARTQQRIRGLQAPADAAKALARH
jgi:hypothetical protein